MKTWASAPERGAAWLVRLMLWLLRHVGWFATGIVLPGISLWFFLSSPGARAASRTYLSAALGRKPGWRDVLRHIHIFACSILDRTLLLTRPSGSIRLEVDGLEHVERVVLGGRGCILLGAHLGSFAVLRQLAERCPVPVRVLMHRDNAGPFTRAMEALDPDLARNTIPVGTPGTLLQAHEAVSAGAVLGVLADRSPPGAQCVTAAFFGREAPFPTGPFVLAASLGVPVVLFCGVRTGRRRYTVRFEPFEAPIVLRRATRQDDLRAAVARYAAWLERSCRAHPFNWFNFYDFWERGPNVSTKARPLGAAAGLGAAAADPVPEPERGLAA